MSYRCALARENAFFSQEIRQLLYGKGRHTYRIIFTILETQEPPTIRITSVRNAAQNTLGAPPAADDI